MFVKRLGGPAISYLNSDGYGFSHTTESAGASNNRYEISLCLIDSRRDRRSPRFDDPADFSRGISRNDVLSPSCKESGKTFPSPRAAHRDENNANNRDTVNHVNESRRSVLSHAGDTRERFNNDFAVQSAANRSDTYVVHYYKVGESRPKRSFRRTP